MRPETHPSPEPGPLERRLVRWPWRPSDVHACDHPPRGLITVRGLRQGDFVQCLTCGWERPA